MKARTTILIPITLGLMMSACSTTSRQQTDGITEPVNNQIESPLQSSEVSSKEIELEKVLESKVSLIDTLQQQLAANKKQLFALNQSLDEKDARIAALQKSANNAESLMALEEQKKLRQALESALRGV